MKAIITDGHYYIKQGFNNAYEITANRDSAKIFEESSCQGAIQALPKILHKYNWRAEVVVEEEGEEESFINSYEEIDTEFLLSQIKTTSELILKAKNNMLPLNHMLSQVDLEICDVLHFLEFFNFSACEGYKLAKLLKDLRVKRREIKNEIKRIDVLKNVSTRTLTSGKTMASLKQVDNQNYVPRVLVDMFEGRKPANE